MSTFAPHEYLPYPEGHNVSSTCIKCGRKVDHELHDVFPQAVVEALQCGATWNDGRPQVCVLEKGHTEDHMSINEVINKIRELS